MQTALTARPQKLRSVYKDKIGIDCIMVCLYLMSLPFTIVSTPFGSVLRLITIPVILVLAASLFIGKKQLHFNFIHLFLGMYIAYTILGLLIKRDEIAVVDTRDMLQIFLVTVLITMRTYNDTEMEMFENAWLFVGIFCIFTALTSNEMINEFENRIEIKIFGYTEDQNHFCAYMIMPVLICMKRFTARRKFFPLYIIGIILMIMSVLKTGSRGGLLGISVGIIIYLFVGMKGMNKKLLLLAALIFLAAVTIIFIFPMLPEDIRERYTVSKVLETGATGRFEAWAVLLRYVFSDADVLLRGGGILSTEAILHASDLPINVAHNTFIQILADQGLIGLILFLLTVAACFARTMRRRPMYAAAFAAIMTFSISLTFYVFKPYVNILIMCAMTNTADIAADGAEQLLGKDGKVKYV